MVVGDKLNPQRSFRKRFALKHIWQHIIKANIIPLRLVLMNY